MKTVKTLEKELEVIGARYERNPNEDDLLESMACFMELLNAKDAQRECDVVMFGEFMEVTYR